MELLASIAIVAVLVSLLFAGVSKIVGKGYVVRCASNFRVMGQAIMLYAADNDGRLPGPLSAGQANFYSVRPNGTIRLQSANLLSYLQPYLGEPPLVATGKDELYYPLLCPAWLKQRTADGKSKEGVAFQANNLEFGNASLPASSIGTPQKLAAVATPGSVKVAWEIDQSVTGWGGNQNLISKPAHGTIRHCLFLDGHVEAQPVENKP